MTPLLSLVSLGCSFLVSSVGSFSSTQTIRSWRPLAPVLSPFLSSCSVLFPDHFFHFCHSNYHLSASLLRAALSSGPIYPTAHGHPHLDVSNSTCPKQNSVFSNCARPNLLLFQCPPCFINGMTVHPVGQAGNLTITWQSSPLLLRSHKLPIPPQHFLSISPVP